MNQTYVPGKMRFLCLLTIVLGLPASLALTAQQPLPVPPPAQPEPPEHPLDKPINWLREAKHNFDKVVKNYTCTLIKKERINGVMQDQNVILFSARVQPFSVYMKWVSPSKHNGREVAYVQGRNNDNMRVKDNKIGTKLLWVNISPDDPRVMQESRHSIREAGLGHMIDRNLKNLEFARQVNKTQVRIAPFSFDKRDCDRVETVNVERNPNFYCYRSVIYLEQKSKIPMRLENYDWPTATNPSGELLEEFSYASLAFNVPMAANLFDK